MSKVDVSLVGGPLMELTDQLKGENGAERLAEFNLWLKGVAGKLLKHLRDVRLDVVTRFVASEKFTKSNPLVKFWYFGENFVTHFGSRIEENISATTIAVSRLERRAKDPEIKATLAGGETVRVFTISLAHFYQMIETQGHGQAGTLLVDGKANIDYIDGVDNWTVYAFLSAGFGWHVDAISVDYPDPWYDEYQVLSRKSSGI